MLDIENKTANNHNASIKEIALFRSNLRSKAIKNDEKKIKKSCITVNVIFLFIFYSITEGVLKNKEL